jgi:hypothetical protein
MSMKKKKTEEEMMEEKLPRTVKKELIVLRKRGLKVSIVALETGDKK